MQIHYDLDGRHGTLTCTERTNLPPIWGLLLVGALCAITRTAVAVFGAMDLDWDDAVDCDAKRLADALHGLPHRDLGDRSEVPEAPINARQPERS